MTVESGRMSRFDFRVFYFHPNSVASADLEKSLRFGNSAGTDPATAVSLAEAGRVPTGE